MSGTGFDLGINGQFATARSRHRPTLEGTNSADQTASASGSSLQTRSCQDHLGPVALSCSERWSSITKNVCQGRLTSGTTAGHLDSKTNRVHNILSPRDDRGQRTDIQLMVNATEMDVTSWSTFVTHHDVFVTRRSSIVSQSSVVSSLVTMSSSVILSSRREQHVTSPLLKRRGARHDEVRRSVTTGVYNRKRSTADA